MTSTLYQALRLVIRRNPASVDSLSSNPVRQVFSCPLTDGSRGLLEIRDLSKVTRAGGGDSKLGLCSLEATESFRVKGRL